MRSKTVQRRKSSKVAMPAARTKSLLHRALSRRDIWLAPGVLGLAAWLVFPAVPAQGDLTDLLSGIDRGRDQWRMVMTNSPAGSLHNASLAFPGGGSVLGGDAGMTLPDGRRVAFTGNEKSGEDTPDEDRVNRAEKKSRIVAVEQMQPPKAFSAGSILERSSSLTTPVDASDEMTAFVKAEADDQPVELAEFYFRKDEVKEPGLPSMLADLITNEKADVLATAYAPAKPDFSRKSPFDAILGAKPETGRFIPPIGPEDHAWAATALPEGYESIVGVAAEAWRYLEYVGRSETENRSAGRWPAPRKCMRSCNDLQISDWCTPSIAIDHRFRACAEC